MVNPLHLRKEANVSVDAIRVEKGRPSAEELAALTAVLLSRTGTEGGGDEPAAQRVTARWRRLERVSRFPGPRSWRA
ncbi:MAG TPA: acyl-CoA carboxylase subunit epsilon [Streptomyces sp.]|nr:acyl-CoA carboxylase subunit epsilon [Streptomyces sp.]